MTNALDREHASWVGRKTAALRRPTLDCGHRNGGDVYFHMWCDRLSCSTACAEAVHDCREYKGGIEEESAPVEQVVRLPEDMAGTVGTTRVLDERHVFTLADMEAASAAVRACSQPLILPGDMLAVTELDGTRSDYTVTNVAPDGTMDVEPVPPPVDAALEEPISSTACWPRRWATRRLLLRSRQL